MTATSAQKPEAGPGDEARWRLLSPTERVIVDLVVRGFSNPQIADELTVSVNTVKTHLKNVFRKVGVTTRSQLAARSAARAPGEQPE